MFGDKFKKGLKGATDKVTQLTQRGKLEVERMDAESELRRRHTELGKAIAIRLLERNETEILRGDPHVRQLLEGVERAQKRLADIHAATDEIKGE